MGHKSDNIEFFGKFFLDKKEEPRSSREEEYIHDWYAKHSDIFEDDHKRYFAIMIIHKMYHQEQWSTLEGEKNFLQSFLRHSKKLLIASRQAGFLFLNPNPKSRVQKKI